MAIKAENAPVEGVRLRMNAPTTPTEPEKQSKCRDGEERVSDVTKIFKLQNIQNLQNTSYGIYVKNRINNMFGFRFIVLFSFRNCWFL